MILLRGWSMKPRGRRWWRRLTSDQKDAYVQKAVAKKAKSPERKRKVAEQRRMLIEERKRMFGDRWKEDCPFDVGDDE